MLGFAIPIGTSAIGTIAATPVVEEPPETTAIDATEVSEARTVIFEGGTRIVTF